MEQIVYAVKVKKNIAYSYILKILRTYLVLKFLCKFYIF